MTAVDTQAPTFDAAEAAKRLGGKTTTWWVENEARFDRIPYIRIGRQKLWTQELIDRILADRVVDPAQKGRKKSR
jgi:hypothetical protein